MFSLNSLNSQTKTLYLKKTTSCVRDQDAATAPARHGLQRGSLTCLSPIILWVQFMFQWIIRFPELAEFTEFELVSHVLDVKIVNILFTIVRKFMHNSYYLDSSMSFILCSVRLYAAPRRLALGVPALPPHQPTRCHLHGWLWSVEAQLVQVCNTEMYSNCWD